LEVDLAPGQLQVLDLDASALGLQTGMRTEVQSVVTLAGSTGSACAVSAQAIDKATGQSGTYQAIVVSQ
jgi:hypothetical protein